MKIKNKILWVMIILAIVSGISMYIYYSTPKNIKIGVEFNLSGNYSYMGISENKILNFLLTNYFKDLPVEIKTLDDESSPTKVKSVIKELKKWGAKVIIGGAISKVGVPASIESTKEKIPFLGTSSTSARLFGKKDYYFTSDYSNSIISKATGIMLRNSNVKNLLVICSRNNKAYSLDLANQIKKYIKKFRILEIEDEKIIDLENIYNTIEKGKIDSVLFTVDSRTTAIIIQKIKTKISNLKFFGTGWNSDNNLIKFGGDSVNGFESVSTYPKIPNDRMKKIEDEYREEYNDNISDFFIFVYNDLVMLSNAIKDGCKTREEFYKYFSTPRVYNGVDDKFSINKFGDAERSYVYLLYVKNNSWQQKKLKISN